MGFLGEPIWVSTLSSHWRGPCRWISIQHGVEVTSCRWYSAPQPLTKLILIVHILVSSYTASKPWFTELDSSCANSWLLKIFKLKQSLELGVTESVKQQFVPNSKKRQFVPNSKKRQFVPSVKSPHFEKATIRAICKKRYSSQIVELIS